MKRWEVGKITPIVFLPKALDRNLTMKKESDKSRLQVRQLTWTLRKYQYL